MFLQLLFPQVLNIHDIPIINSICNGHTCLASYRTLCFLCYEIQKSSPTGIPTAITIFRPPQTVIFE